MKEESRGATALLLVLFAGFATWLYPYVKANLDLLGADAE
jgi:hypothetical protein